MRCRRCHWRTSLWECDLLSGLCVRCQRVAAEKPSLDPQAAVREALCSHGEASLKSGMPPEELERRLTTAGLSPQDAAEAVKDVVAQRAPYVLAASLLNGGASREETRLRLVETGLDPNLAVWVIDQVQRERSGESRPAERRVSALVVLGVCVSALGFVLVIGNCTGLAPTFPFAGFIALAFGSLLITVGQRRP